MTSFTPEHDKRCDPNSDDSHPEVQAAYDYVYSVLHTSDVPGGYAWHGWALREAFLAGCSYAANKAQEVKA